MKPPMCAPCATPPPRLRRRTAAGCRSAGTCRARCAPGITNTCIRNGAGTASIRTVLRGNRRSRSRARPRSRPRRRPSASRIARRRAREERRGDAGGEVREQVRQRPEPVLDVVAVDPEEQHVPDQVHEAAVQEHARSRSATPAPPAGSRARRRTGRTRSVCATSCRNCAAALQLLRHYLHVLAEARVAVVRPLRAERQVDQQEHGDVRRDQQVGEVRRALRVGSVADRDEHVATLFFIRA